LDSELDKIASLIEEFPFVSMDTEFPGTYYENQPQGDPRY